ncbi:MAG: helix-turn-helix domain-containing protein [Nitrospirota bacterium]
MRSDKTMSEKKESADDLNFSELLENKFSAYLKKIRHSNPRNLYTLLISECEKSLFHLILQETEGNQLKAAKMLGINRNTLRKKIEAFKIEIEKVKKTSAEKKSTV